MTNNKICCFIGHRKIENDIDIENLKLILIDLIENYNVHTFLFGSRSQFDDLCKKMIDELKIKYDYIKRVYVRAVYPNITNYYKEYLLEHYEDTYYPQECTNVGKLVYIKRNENMINNSDYCVFYYKQDYEQPIKKQSAKLKNFIAPTKTQSGTTLAYQYATKHKKQIINVI